MDEVNNEDWLIELGNILGDKEYVEKTYANFSEEKVQRCLMYVYTLP